MAAQVASKVKSLLCLDISDAMLKRAQVRLEELGHRNVDFELLQADEPYPAEFAQRFDVVYSFDVFVHMDLHEMRHTLACVHSILKPGRIR